ncbi:MAG TPA: acyl-CoA dehydrogenase family protein [Acidimicrobiales bacterium]|nr:acyl-CoA dehydrogenase family protein [Acidimicrobiales bacterium]
MSAATAAGGGEHLGPLLDDLRRWLGDNWDPDLTVREWWERLAASGWSQPQWPEEWFGKGLDRAAAAAVSRTIAESGALAPPGGFGTSMAGPTLLVHGTDDQRRRHLPGMVTGTDAFCQLFSEPNAGSDLAGLQTRAERDGNEWVVNGQKVWTSDARMANKAMLLARTNVDVPKHAGISYFIIDMDQAGIEVRPLREMTGRAFFNEVFIVDARVRADDLVGGEGNGWAVANTTLAFERALSGGGGPGSAAHPGPVAGDLDRRAGDLASERRATEGESAGPPTLGRLLALARRAGRTADPVVRQELARLYTLERLNALTSQRAIALQSSGADLPGLPNLAKMAQNHAMRLGRHLTFSILGAAATLHGYDPGPARRVEAATGVDGLTREVEGALFATAPPIYGGSDQIQRNIVGERVLGLPREPGQDRHVAFRDLPKN